MLHATGSGGLARSQLASLWIKDHPGQGSLPLHALESSKVPRATIDCFLDACADIVQTRHVPTAAPPPSSSASMCGAGSGGLHIFARGLPRRVNDPPPPPHDGRQACNECGVQGKKLERVQARKLQAVHRVQAEKLERHCHHPATYYCLECLQRWERREGEASNGVVRGLVSIASAQEHRGEEAASGPVVNTAATPAERVEWAEKCLLKFENVAEVAKEMQLVLGRLGFSCFSAASSSCTTTTVAGRAAVCDASDGAAAGQTAEADFLAQLDALEGCMEPDACIKLGFTPA